jgi:hypothetical protein
MERIGLSHEICWPALAAEPKIFPKAIPRSDDGAPPLDWTAAALTLLAATTLYRLERIVRLAVIEPNEVAEVSVFQILCPLSLKGES